MSGISEVDYVCWVQRSLNRLINAQLPVNGEKSTGYVEKVKTLQAISPALSHYCDPYGVKNKMWGKVDERTQNVIVEWNNTMFGYMGWVQTSLKTIGMHANMPTGVLDSDTLQSIRFFQKQKQLKIDGWVGAKTETALIKAARSEPPQWEFKEPKPWHQNQDKKVWMNRFIADILREFDAPTRAPFLSIDPTFRQAYRCMLYKITYTPGTFHGYLTPYWVQWWINAGKDQNDLKIILSRALPEIENDFDRVWRDYAYATEDVARSRFEQLVVEMMKKIDAGRDRINYANSVLGDLGHVRSLYRWWQEAEGSDRTLYGCFQGHLKREYTGPWSPSVPEFLDVLAQCRSWANSRK
ncbi:MAG: peptidoglycan-binding protein [Bryobacterales bacterium]|nr:peptidoglycan-binding protein [Bryobacterales bacterium]